MRVERFAATLCITNLFSPGPRPKTNPKRYMRWMRSGDETIIYYTVNLAKAYSLKINYCV